MNFFAILTSPTLTAWIQIGFSSLESLFSLSKEKNINAFQKYLSQKGFISTVRTTRGDDIDGACGQLIGNLNKAAHGKKAIERQISA